MKIKSIFSAIFLSGCAYLTASGQGSDIYGSGLKLNLNEDGSKYVRFIIWNQIWARQTANNPNTMVNGERQDHTFDVGIRRARVLAYAQITPRFLVLTHFGINNQTFSTGGASGSAGTGGYGAGKKPGIFIHDAWVEYRLLNPKNPVTGKPGNYSLNFGAGIHYFNGISRMSSASTLNFLAIDAPVFNWPLIENSDQFARQMGIFLKGNVANLHFSFALNKPFATNAEPLYHPVAGQVAVDNSGATKASVQGYVDYHFFEQESNFLPFRVGTYLGSKKVFNVGAGFYHQPGGTKSIDIAGNLSAHNINLFGLDVFADLPFGSPERNAAFTGYSVFYNFNFGPNYIRNIGIMNYASGLDPAAIDPASVLGAGNARAMLGTGNIWYTQLGYLIPKFSKSKNEIRWQPFLAYTYKDLEFHNHPGNYFDIGANILLSGHHAKITPQLSFRPLYFSNTSGFYVDGYKPEFIVQLQVYL